MTLSLPGRCGISGAVDSSDQIPFYDSRNKQSRRSRARRHATYSCEPLTSTFIPARAVWTATRVLISGES